MQKSFTRLLVTDFLTAGTNQAQAVITLAYFAYIID